MWICPEKSRVESCLEVGLDEPGTERLTDCEGCGEFNEREAEMGKGREEETLSLRVLAWPDIRAELETGFFRI